VNDLEQDLRELFEARSRNATPTPTAAPNVLKRARRRQAATASGAIVGVVAILVGSILGVRALGGSDAGPRPAVVPVLPSAPEGFRGVVLPYASLIYPEGWFLVELDPASSRDRVFQLTNFDAGATWVDCENGGALPPGGVLLEVQLGALQEALPGWPTQLGVVPGGGGPCGADGVLGASWTANGTAFSATGLLARDAAQEDVDLLEGAFESLAFPQDAPQTEDFFGTSNLVLDSAASPVGPFALYAYEDGFDGGSTWIGVAGPAGSRLSGAGQIGRDVPTGDEGVTMSLGTWGGVVWGDVSTDVARAELRTVEGETYPATILALPQSLHPGLHQAVWGIVDSLTEDRVTTLLYDQQGNVLNDFYPTGARVTIATGTDPKGGPWDLFLESSNEGTGLSFSFTNGGGGGGCCLRPLHGAFQLDGWSSGGDGPNPITALASDAVSRVEFQASNGTTLDGLLYPVPDASLGVPQVALVLVPSDVPLTGDLVAFDTDGNEVGREFVGDLGEPKGPTPEIDAVWNLLRRARDAVQRWAGHHGDSLETFTVDEAISSIPDIPWNASEAGKPVPNEISIRGVAPAGGSELTGWSGWDFVLVSITPDLGHTYCIAVNIDENGGGNFRYGTQDAATYEGCRDGWG
jgi:hypothetical protein